MATAWVRIGRLVAGSDWAPSLACFAHPAPADATEHTRVFAAPLRFSSLGNALHIPNPLLDVPNPRADASLGVVLDKYVAEVLGRLPRRTTLSDRLRAWLLGTLSDGEPGAAAAARALSLSVRSLHRGLRAENATFRALLDRLRHERAAHLLANQRYSVTEVAFLLGFSEQSSFCRAFKRWAGTTPAEFRASGPARGNVRPATRT